MQQSLRINCLKHILVFVFQYFGMKLIIQNIKYRQEVKKISRVYFYIFFSYWHFSNNIVKNCKEMKICSCMIA